MNHHHVRRIQGRLELLGLSKAKLARILGVHPSCLSRYWRYDTPPEWFLAQLGHLLGWSQEQLSGEDPRDLIALHPLVGTACPRDVPALRSFQSWFTSTYAGPAKNP